MSVPGGKQNPLRRLLGRVPGASRRGAVASPRATVSREEALGSALEYLTRAYAGEYTIVLQPELTVEYPAAWAVRFTSREYLDTGDRGREPFIRVVIVPKDGSGPRFPPSSGSVEEFVAELSRTGSRP